MKNLCAVQLLLGHAKRKNDEVISIEFAKYWHTRQNRIMAFSIDMPAAARRHLMAADELLVSPKGRKAVAGYLFGIAAECAVKAMMSDAGCKSNGGRDDPYYQHFPDLRTSLRDALTGRKAAPLINFINDNSFMNNWSTRMRYSSGKDIKDKWIDDWAKQARQVVASIGT